MTVFPDFVFFLYLPVFFLATLLAFFIPGDLVVRRFKLGTIARLTLSFILGICFWALHGLVVGYLNARYLSYVYLLTSATLWLRSYQDYPFTKPRWDWFAMAIIFAGGIIQLSAIWLVGSRLSDSLAFCCRSVPDAIYHLSLTSELVRSFPPFEPGSTGIVVSNYHYLSNLVMADLVRVFHLPLIPTVYQYVPILLVISLGFSVLTFSEIISAPRLFKYLVLFFVFFSGDINYLLTLITSGKLDMPVTGFDSAALLLTGPPRAFSIVIFFGLICFVALWIKRKNWLVGLSISLLAASLVGFKIYTAAAAFVGLGCLTIYYLVKKDFTKAWPVIVAVIVALLIYLPVNAGAGGLVFSHFWRLEDFIVKSQFNLSYLELARQTYQAAGNWVRVLGYEALFFLIYVLFNFGTSTFAFVPLKRVRQLIPQGVVLFLFSGQLALLALGIFFFQKTGGANTIQFLISLETISAILAAAVAVVIFRSLPRWASIVLGIVMIVLTGTRVINIFWENTVDIKNREWVVVSPQEIEALDYLNCQTPSDSVMAISPNLASQTRSLYIPLLSNRPAFLAGISDHGVAGLDKRVSDNKKLFQGGDIQGVNYLYVAKDEPLDTSNFAAPLEKVFENQAVGIYLLRPRRDSNPQQHR